MKQFIQNFQTGKMQIDEVPPPALKNGFVLVENRFSLISTGTERATVDIGKASLFDKAMKRPDLVKEVLQNIRREGILSTLQKVRTRLDAPKALGYSCCGTVIESKDFDKRFRKGDRVACAGQDYASHAEVVAVPQNLVVKIPEGVSFEEASFTTVGAIALQGIRQAGPIIGERVCVIGLGLMGQLTCQILKTNGCYVFGIDLSDFAVETAKRLGTDFAINRNDQNLYNLADGFTKGYGFDKVIITASSAGSNDPIVLSTELVRKKGTVVVVGDVKMDIPREPHFYKKELELKIATSYGPGRYDPLYEEAGIDYPYGYVRFTENRNMEAFLGFVASRGVRVPELITHIFDFEKADNAYDLITGRRKENFLGILLKYKDRRISGFANKVAVAAAPIKEINIGFIGAGSFAQNYLLRRLKRPYLSLDTLVTTKGITAKNAARKFGFRFATCDSREVFTSKDINTVFIATTHNTHAQYVCEALKAGKNLFVEKPLCINIQELKEIVSAYRGQGLLMAGFNRRFSQISSLINNELRRLSTPVQMNFRINAGFIPKGHWVQNADIGGGRIIGEVCHFIDLMLFFSNSKPKRLYTSSVSCDSGSWSSDDNVAINIEFENGSMGSIVYTAMGNPVMEKERLEIFASGNAYLINDFKEAVFYRNNGIRRFKNKGKGHKEEIDSFIDALRKGQQSPIDFESIVYTTLATFKAAESLKDGQPKDIDASELY